MNIQNIQLNLISDKDQVVDDRDELRRVNMIWTCRIQQVLCMFTTITTQLAFSVMIIQHHFLPYHLPGLKLDFLPSLLLLLVSLPVVQAQADLGAAGAFNTSVLGALYGLGLAAVSIERFPVANLTWTSELWGRFVELAEARVRDSHKEMNGSEGGNKSKSENEDSGTQAQATESGAASTGAGNKRSEIMQLRWFGGESSILPWWTRWSAYDSPYPLFNGLGAHRVVVIVKGPDKRATFTGGAWVCIDEDTAKTLSGANNRAFPPKATSCGGYHYWTNHVSWWLAVRLIPFTAEVDGKTLNSTGCLEYTRSIEGATAQACHSLQLPAKVKHLRFTPDMYMYTRMDRSGLLDPKFYPKTRTLMSILANADEAIIFTQDFEDTLGMIWAGLASKEGRGGERELDRLTHLDSLFENPEPDSYFRINFTRIAPSSAIIPHFIETAVTLILPWFGVTSLVIIEQISRKAVWSSLSTGSARYVHSYAYGGELTGMAKNACSYVTLVGGPTRDLFWLISVFRLLFTLGSYIVAIWVQVALSLNLPTHDDVLSIQAARVAGTTAAVVHVVTTISIFALIGRARPVFVPFLAAVLMTAIAALEWSNVVSGRVVGPVILAAEFMSSVVQTPLNVTVADAAPLEGWRHTMSALCAEMRVALILALPRVAAWFRTTGN
jgi:hypothetical protein